MEADTTALRRRHRRRRWCRRGRGRDRTSVGRRAESQDHQEDPAEEEQPEREADTVTEVLGRSFSTMMRMTMFTIGTNNKTIDHAGRPTTSRSTIVL